MYKRAQAGYKKASQSDTIPAPKGLCIVIKAS
jgi:hypothetical protein